MPDIITNPVKAIRAHCLDCCYDNAAEVKACPVEKCVLHPFRLGKNPYRARREYTDAERAAMRARLQSVREKSQTNYQGNQPED